MSRKGAKKPAREMTTEEAAERLFGKRVVKKVRKELEPSEPIEKSKKNRSSRSINKKDS